MLGLPNAQPAHAACCPAHVKTAVAVAPQFLVRNGFYLILDNPTEDPPLTQFGLATWVQAWANLTADVVADEPFRLRVIMDLINEPDHASLNWTGVRPPLKAFWWFSGVFDQASIEWDVD